MTIFNFVIANNCSYIPSEYNFSLNVVNVKKLVHCHWYKRYNLVVRIIINILLETVIIVIVYLVEQRFRLKLMGNV